MLVSRPVRRLLPCLLALLLLTLALPAMPAKAATGPFFISELLFNPPGTDEPNEYVEIRGTPSATIPAGTYLLGIEGDADVTSPSGDVQTIFNLGGLTLGSNGFLVLLQSGNTYTTVAGATVVASTATGWSGLSGSRFSADNGDTDIENASATYMLVQSAAAPTLASDLDANDDGTADGAFFGTLTLLDSVGVLDDAPTNNATDRTYGEITVKPDTSESAGSGTIFPFPPGVADYVARSGNSTGAAVADWVVSDQLSGAANTGYTLQAAFTLPDAADGQVLNHIGGPNPGAGVVPPPTVTLIRSIQGAAHTSPLSGTLASNVQGIVTAVSRTGFYVQDPNPDANDATSEAMFVFTNTGGAKPVVGTSVAITGTVSEFRAGGAGGTNLSLTQLSSATVVTLATGLPLPPPIVIGSGGRVPPAVIDNDTTGSVETGPTIFDPSGDAIDFYESLESMRVQVNDGLAVGPTNGFGETPVIPDGGTGVPTTTRTVRGGVVVGDDYSTFNGQRVFVDDGILTSTTTLNVGDRFAAPVVGVLDYSFGNFKLFYTAPLPAVISAGLQRETLGFAPRLPGQLSVGTFNVENLAPGSDITTTAKFASLASIVVNNLRVPDILALEEVQDNSGPASDGVVAADLTYTQLISAVLAAGGPRYEFRQIDPENNTDGGQPGGNIRVGFLFNPARVQFVDRPGGTATTAVAVTAGPDGPQLSASPGRIDPTNAAFTDSRKPLAGEFRFGGRTVFVVANHFNSKGGDQPLFGRFQQPQRSSETQRLGQAQAVNSFVKQILALDSRASVVVLGDINDFEFSPVTAALESGALTSLVKTLPKSERYSYVFEGNSQVLDQLLVSSALLSATVGYDVVHVNSEFADQISDHDPQVALFSLSQPTLTAIGTYDTGLGEGNAEIVDVRGNRAVLTNSGGASIDILDIGSLPVITRTQRVALPPGLAGINSAAIHPSKDLFVTVAGSAGQQGSMGLFRLSDGALLVSTTLGIQPDSVDISPDGRFAVVANEAEGVEAAGSTPSNNGGVGSLSLVNLEAFDPASPSVVTATNVALPSQVGTAGFGTGRFDDLARLPIDNSPETLEPETVAFSADSQFAFISLQENNGVVRLTLADNSLQFFGLGQTTHAADLTVGGGYQPFETLTAFREPDGVALTPDGRFFVTANEGDTRPSAASAGVRGGRTVAVFDAATGALVGETGSQIDDLAAARGRYPDNRSNRGGSEPEVLDLAVVGGRTIVAVGLERANAVALVDISTPATPQVFGLIPTGAGPEGIKLVEQGGTLFVLAASEAAGSLTAAVVATGPLALRQTYAAGTPLALRDFVALDTPAAAVLTVTLQLSRPSAGTLSADTVGGASASYDSARGLLTATGPVSDLNGLLAGVLFTPRPGFIDSVTVAISVLDGASAPVTGTLLLSSDTTQRTFFLPLVGKSF